MTMLRLTLFAMRRAAASLVFLVYLASSSVVMCTAKEVTEQEKVEVLASVVSLFEKAYHESRAQLSQLDLTPEEQVEFLIHATTKLTTKSDDVKDDEDDKANNKDNDSDDDEEEDPEDIVTRHSFYYADRHIDDVLKIVNDPDCLSREFDVTTADYDPVQVADVLFKCRLVVLRKVFDPNFILQEFKPKFHKYLQALKSGRVNPKRRVIYMKNRPSKRYEIMLPEPFAMDELIRNEQILEIVEQPHMLSNSYFLHSLGAVVTEPGAPHQNWHEEDNYILDSFHSFENFGVAGHDLPPYVINMFSPLLNLTHDHGPTEFCVGSSITTGLLSEHFGIHNATALKKDVKEGDVFGKLLEFHQRAIGGGGSKPCPTAHLRSVLLNVGDVVLFDYQILHRAGHNNPEANEDTRAQIYLAYARSWFRDFNYDSNEFDSYEKRDRDLYNPYLANTRFALDVPDEIFEDNDAIKDEELIIERMRNIIPQTPLPERATKRKIQFIVSNKDLPEGSVYLQQEHEQLGSDVTQPLVAPGANQRIKTRVGSRFSLHRSSDGAQLKEWKIPHEMDQLVVSREIVGLQQEGETSTTT